MNPAPRASEYPIGATMDSASLSDDPYPLLARLRENEPVSWAPQLERWLVTPRSLVMQVVLDPETFTTASERSPISATFGPQMLSTDGDEQRRHRAPLVPAFLPRALRGEAEDRIQRLMDHLVAELPSGRRADLAPLAAGLAIGTVVDVLGLVVDDISLVRSWYEDLAASLANVASDPAVLSRGIETAEVVREHVLDSVDGSALLRNALGELGPRDLGSNALLILFGGIETTESMILNAIWAVLMHPDSMKAARTDPANAIEESLRWEPAVQTLTRYAMTDVELVTSRIPAGSTIECMIGAVNRDPAHFEAPDIFDPTRPNARDHLTFGHGRHACIGMHLGRMEARVALGTLFNRLHALRLDSDRPGRPSGHEFRKVRPLWVRWDA